MDENIGNQGEHLQELGEFLIHGGKLDGEEGEEVHQSPPTPPVCERGEGKGEKSDRSGWGRAGRA